MGDAGGQGDAGTRGGEKNLCSSPYHRVSLASASPSLSGNTIEDSFAALVAGPSRYL